MKICITTYHCAYNYGAVLQSFSLMRTLQRMGHDVQFLNYWPAHRVAAREKFWALKFNKAGIAGDLVKLFKYKQLREWKNRFNSFRKDSLNLTREYNSLAEICADTPKVDAFVTGSDQVWNPKEYDPVYFLPFAKNVGAKSIAYAPSVGECQIPESVRGKWIDSIRGMDFVSSRELDGSRIIEAETGRKCKTVLDPVLMQTKREWSEIVGEPLIKGDYIAVYAIRRRRHMELGVEQIAKKTGLPVVLLIGAPFLFGRMKTDKILFDAGPKEFVNVLYHSKIVCTNSFHGTAFSTIFEKPFFVFSHTREDYRAQSLMRQMGTTNRLILPNEKISADIYDIDFGENEKKLGELRADSMTYLKDALSAR